MVPTWVEVVMNLAELAAPVLMALLGWVSVRVAYYIREKVGQEAYAGALLRLNDSVLTLVREAEQTYVREMKLARSNASPGGVRLTKDEATRIKQAVIDSFMRLWGRDGLVKLMKVLGLNEGALEDFIGAKIEEAVNVEKQRRPS